MPCVGCAKQFQPTHKFAVVSVCNILQPTLNKACIAAKAVTRGNLRNQKASVKGKVGPEYAAAFVLCSVFDVPHKVGRIRGCMISGE